MLTNNSNHEVTEVATIHDNGAGVGMENAHSHQNGKTVHAHEISVVRKGCIFIVDKQTTRVVRRYIYWYMLWIVLVVIVVAGITVAITLSQ